MSHISVLPREAIEALKVIPGSRIIDGTINGGGHSRRIVELLQGQGVLLGIDLDAEALERAREHIGKTSAQVHLFEGNFAQMDRFAREAGVSDFTGILLDLGLSSNQLESSGRGFSFQKDEPLSMTLTSRTRPDAFTAEDIINDWEEGTIADIIYGYGEERFARRIARGIVEARKKKAITTTTELVEVIRQSTPGPYHRGKTHPATRTFQALRIAVNDELESLRKGVQVALSLLAPQGRLVIISFHSIEDRIVKRAFLEAQKEEKGTIITKKPLAPSEEEIKENPRARSAKLRVFEVC